MAELDTIEIINPLAEDFTVRFNGEPYTLKAGAQVHYPRFLALHIARHISDKLLSDKKEALRKKHGKDNPYVPQASTLFNHDNPSRRIALYQILRDTELVQEAVTKSNLKGFVGEMAEYDEYIASQQKATKITEEEESPAKKTKKTS